MQIQRTNLDGSGTQVTEVTFSNPQDYIDYAQSVSAEGCQIVVGEGFDNDRGRKTINVVAISGTVTVDNIAR